MNPNEREALKPNLTTLAIFFLAVATLLLLKSPDVLTNPQFYAEDGTVFFQQQFGHSFPLLFRPYAGYLNVVPRTIAWLATIFSYKDAPLVYNLSTLCIDTGAIVYFSLRSRSLVPMWIVIAAFMLTPSSGEVFGTLTNAQWFLQFVLFAAALYPSAHIEMRRNIFPSIVVLVIAMTGPFSIFCALIGFVLFIVQLASKFVRTKMALATTVRCWWEVINKRYLSVIFIGGVIQACLLTFTSHRHSWQFSFEAAKSLFVEGFQFHIFGIVLLPNLIFSCIAGALLLFACIHVCRRPTISYLIFVAMLAFISMEFIGMSSQANLSWLVRPAAFTGDRYYFFAQIASWTCIAFVLRGLRHDKSSNYQFLAPIGLVLVALLNVQSLRRPPLPNMHWKQASSVIDSTQRSVVIPINPVPWKIRITREGLEAASSH